MSPTKIYPFKLAPSLEKTPARFKSYLADVAARVQRKQFYSIHAAKLDKCPCVEPIDTLHPDVRARLEDDKGIAPQVHHARYENMRLRQRDSTRECTAQVDCRFEEFTNPMTQGVAVPDWNFHVGKSSFAARTAQSESRRIMSQDEDEDDLDLSPMTTRLDALALRPILSRDKSMRHTDSGYSSIHSVAIVQ